MKLQDKVVVVTGDSKFVNGVVIAADAGWTAY